MNIVFLIGEIITDIEYKFIYDRFKISLNEEKYKHIAIAKCEIKLLNDSKLQVYGYDNIADMLYRIGKIGKNVLIEGYLDGQGSVETIKLNTL